MTMEKVRLKAKERYEKFLLNKKIDDKQKKNLEDIIKFLEDDSCFVKININFALIILISIGYTKDEAKDLYIKLIKEGKKSLKGKYNLINPQDLGLK